MIYYQIFVSTDKGKTWDLWRDHNPTMYKTGAEANVEAKRLGTKFKGHPWSPHTNANFRVRKFAEDDGDNLFTREAAKNHTPLPFEYNQDTPWRLSHMHPELPFTVQYFRTYEDAVEGKYTFMAITRFLTNYLNISNDDAEEILQKIGYYSEKCEVALTQDPDLIQEIYEYGPSSCMANPDEYQLPDTHPSIVYSKGDLALLYAKRGDNKYSTRAVVNTRDNTYYTYYGAFGFIKDWLEENDYTKDKTGGASFIGCRVGAFFDPHSRDDYLMPYLDASSYCRLSDDKEFFILVGDDDDSEATHETQGTEGWACAI